jgi:CBS domain-containing protein
MRVQDLMTQPVQFCASDDSLKRAAQLMWQHDCGCLPVCAIMIDGATQPVGMITDRDICMCALFQDKPLSALRVGDAMSKHVLACKPNDTLERAEEVMRGGRVRRLPVLSEQGVLMGIISLADLAREAARESHRERAKITESDIGDTLAAICERPVQARAA